MSSNVSKDNVSREIVRSVETCERICMYMYYVYACVYVYVYCMLYLYLYMCMYVYTYTVPYKRAYALSSYAINLRSSDLRFAYSRFQGLHFREKQMPQNNKFSLLTLDKLILSKNDTCFIYSNYAAWYFRF